MRRVIIAIVAIVALASCKTSKVTRQQKHITTHTVDTMSRKVDIEEMVETITEAEVIVERVVYDTKRIDSTGKAPVKERTTAKITQKQREQTEVTTAIVEEQTQEVQQAEQEEVQVEKRQSVISSADAIIGIIIIIAMLVIMERIYRKKQIL